MQTDLNLLTCNSKLDTNTIDLDHRIDRDILKKNSLYPLENLKFNSSYRIALLDIERANSIEINGKYEDFDGVNESGIINSMFIFLFY